MNVLVIGGSGHIGTYLIPKLVWAGFKVTNVSRGKSKPYKKDSAWNQVKNVTIDRDQEGGVEFSKKIAALNADIVVDLISFTLESTRQMVNALKNSNLSHYLFCSSIWVHGIAEILPLTEDLPKYPICEYGRQKAESEAWLHTLYRQEGFPETVVMPGQISGPGWNIVSPLGNIDPLVFQNIAQGKEITLPNFGMETLHHVHADDVAQVFFNSITHRKEAVGESFHAVSAESLTLFGYAQALYRWFGKEPQIKFLPWGEWCKHINDEELCNSTYLHIARSGTFSIEKGKRLIGYSPRYTVLEAIKESVASMLERKVIKE